MVPMASLGPAVMAGLVSLALGLERLLSAVLAGGRWSYTSTRLVVAGLCLLAAGVLLTRGATTWRRSRRPPSPPEGGLRS